MSLENWWLENWWLIMTLTELLIAARQLSPIAKLKLIRVLAKAPEHTADFWSDKLLGLDGCFYGR